MGTDDAITGHRCHDNFFRFLHGSTHDIPSAKQRLAGRDDYRLTIFAPFVNRLSTELI
jgi:hypothetical protein